MGNQKNEIICLEGENHLNFCIEGYIEINNNIIEFEKIETGYINTGRGQEYHYVIMKRKSDGKYFRCEYSTSTNENMGWEECNWDDPYFATQVFPKEVKKIIYVESQEIS